MNTSINNESFLVYKASAGSGKTFNLAKAYLQICFTHFDKDRYIYRKILGITFTNKAANEMKTRILSFLQKLSEDIDSELMKEFTDYLPKEEISRRATALLKLIHHDYSNFSIFTIDSFFQQILRTFSYDLYIPANHQIELDANVIIKKAVDIVLSKLGHDPVLTDFILQYAYSQMDRNKNWRIEKNIQTVGYELYNEEAIVAMEHLEALTAEDFKSIIQKLYKEIAVIDNTMKAIAQKAVNAIVSAAVSPEVFFHGKSGIGSWFVKIMEEGMDNFNVNSYVRKSVEENVWTAKTADNDIKSKIESIAPLLRECFQEIDAFKEKNYTTYQVSKAVMDNIYPTAMLNEIKKAINSIKMEESTLHIAETNHYISRIVSSESVPFIYERLGNRYKYFFVDEFQDTSVLQWRNLLPLICEGLSSEVFANETGKSAVFGDAKQAIYRFREGDVRQFNRLPNVDGSEENPILRERERILQDNFKKIDLPNNYRSKEEIVEFNNDFFEYMSRSEKDASSYIVSAYENLRQSCKQNNTGGGVRLYVANKDIFPDDYSYFDYILEETFGIISEVQADGYQLSDVAILCRTKDMASFLAEGISQKGIAVISSDSLLLKNAEEVNFLLACFSYILKTNNELSRAIMLHYLAKEKEKSFENLLVVVKDEKIFLQTIQAMGYAFNPSELKQLNSYELVECLVDIFGSNLKNNPYVLAFKGVVFDFTLTKANKYIDFLEYWEERGDKFTLSNPEGIDAINILTIHKSKGLQFPVVIYPQKSGRNNMPATKWVELDKDIFPMDVAYIKLTKSLENTDFEHYYEEEKRLTALDELNVDYVAYTRAEDRLYLIHPSVKPQASDKPQASVVEFFRSGDYENESEIDGKERYSIGSFAVNEKKAKAKMKENAIDAGSAKGIHLPKLLANRRFESEEMRWGSVMHAYLSYFRKPEDKDYLLQLISEDISFSEQEKKMGLQLIANFLDDANKSILFGEVDAVVKTEVEIFTPDLHSFRIDRLVINKDHCIVIDFKTGNRDASHTKQITRYAELLKEVGYANVYPYLVYISDEGNLQIEKI